MKNRMNLVAGGLFLFVALVCAAAIVWGAPQNNSKSQAQIDNEVYDATSGALQVINLGRGVTSPQSNNLSSAQIANLSYDATNGAIQAILSDQSEDIAFINVSGLVDGQMLRYEDSDQYWHNTASLFDDDGYLSLHGVGTNNARMYMSSAGYPGQIEMGFEVSATFASIYAAGGSSLDIQGNANFPVYFFMSPAAGETPTINISGYRTGDATRTASLAIDDTVNNQFAIEGTASTAIKTGVSLNVVDVDAATYTVAQDDYFVGVSYTGTGTVALTLPSAAAVWSTDGNGPIFVVKDTGANAGANNITISRAGSDTIIDTATGQTSTVISTDGGSLTFQAISASVWAVY